MDNRVVLNDAFKQFTMDQDKILAPQETVKRFKKRLAELDLNILEKTTRIDNGRLGIPIYFSVCGPDAASVTGTAKQMGKGATPAQSEASAVMELAERFSFFAFKKDEANFFTDTYRNVKEKALSFDLIAQSVHDSSDDLPLAKEIFSDLPLKWTKAFNLTRQQEVLIPFDWFFMINEFNGPSAGNCVEEALSQGICEIIERHVSAIVSHGKLKVPAIDPESATDPMVIEMIAKYKKIGVKVFLSDFTLETGIATVGAMAYDPETFPAKSEIVWTAGTTPDPQKALSRALTEVAQLAGDFNTSANYVASGLPKFVSLKEAQYITNAKGKVPIDTLPDLSDNNIKVEVENLIAALAERGMEIIVINTMHAGLKIPAFYTIIPGAHFRERALGTSVTMFSAKMIAENNPPAEAIQKLVAIDKALPGKYYVNFYLGSCHLDNQDPETALTYLEKALTFDPNHQDVPSIDSYTGVCLKDMGRYHEAIEVLSKASKLDEERTDVHNLMGFCHFMLKEHQEAINSFKNVLRLDPTSAIDYANIASNYRDMGKTEAAIRYYEMALELDESIEFARNNLAKLQKDA